MLQLLEDRTLVEGVLSASKLAVGAVRYVTSFKVEDTEEDDYSNVRGTILIEGVIMDVLFD